MSLFNVELTDDFKRDAKKLIKKYRSIASEIRDLIESLETDPIRGRPDTERTSRQGLLQN